MSEEVRGYVLPLYLVADESGSMQEVVHELNAGLRSLLDAMHENSMDAAKVRFSVVGFSDGVQCHLQLANLSQRESMPTLSALYGTAYSVVFTDLRTRLDCDVEDLKKQGYRVHRPAIFFLTDGRPNPGDPWQPALAQLKDPSFKRRPNILAFGIGDAVPAIIAQVATREDWAWVAANGADTGAALSKFMEALTRSVVSSGQAVAEGRAQLAVSKPEGFVQAIELEEV